MSAMNTHTMDTSFNRENLKAAGEASAVDLAAGLRELVDATVACRQTAAQARKTLSGMEPDMRGLRLIAVQIML